MKTKNHRSRFQKLLSPLDDLSFVKAFAPDKLMHCFMEPKERSINIAAVGVMTVGIAHFFPEFVGRGDLEIIVAGASAMELQSTALGFDAMRHWLQVDDLTFEFCGLGIDEALSGLHKHPNLMAELDEWEIVSGMLAHLMWMRRKSEAPLPDLITILHPGIEYSGECWLRDVGLREAAEKGVPILLSAFAEREMHMDRIALEAYGYAVSDPFENRGAPNGAPDPESADPDPRYGGWLYAITGVDVKRWRQPDQKLLSRAFAKRNKLLSIKGASRAQVMGLLHAAHRGRNAYARIEDGVRLKNFAQSQNHPLFYARFRMQSLLLGQPDPNDYYSGQLMRYGASLGVDFVMPYLAANPAVLEARDEEGQTLVFHAIEEGDDEGSANTDLLAQLVGSADLSVVDDHALTPLQVAIQRNNSRAVELLLGAGAPLLPALGARDMVEFLLECGDWPLLKRLVSEHPDAAVRAAVNPVLVQRMLDKGAPASLLKRFRALEYEDTTPTTRGTATAGPDDEIFALSPADAIKLMLAGHSLLEWTNSLDLQEPLNFMEVELAAELGDVELHQAIRAAERANEQLHNDVIPLYGAIVLLVSQLLEHGDYKGNPHLESALESIRPIYSAISKAGSRRAKGFSQRAMNTHMQRHEARYSASLKKVGLASTAARKRQARPGA